MRKLSRKDKCYEKDFKIKLMKMSKQIKRNIKTSPKQINILGGVKIDEKKEKKKHTRLTICRWYNPVSLLFQQR